MNIATKLLFATTGLMLPLSLQAKEPPFAPVQQAVKQRTQRDLRWEADAAARDESRAQVRALLRKPLTATSAVQIALLHHRGLQATFEEIGLSAADLREARTLANPELDLTAKFSDRAPKGTLYEWGLAQNFLDLLMIPLRAKVARDQLAATQMRVADEVVRVVAEVKTAYYEALADQQLLTRLRLVVEAQRASLELAQKLHEAGNITDLKLLQEQAQYSRVRLELAAAESEERAHREKLNRALGLWGADTSWKLAGPDLTILPAGDPALPGLESLAVANRLDLAAARADLESAVKAAGLEKTFRWIGALDFGVEGEREIDGTNLTGPSLRLELPIFNQGQARLARSEAKLRLAAAKFEQLAIDLRSETRETRDRLGRQRDVVNLYRQELLPTMQRITQEMLLHYNAMHVGPAEAFMARKEDLETERALIEAARDYWITRAELERLVGGDLNAPRPSPATKPTTQPSKKRQP